MTLLVFCLLAVLWGAVFIPAIVRARLDSSPIATVGMFRRGMTALGASERTFSEGRWILVPPTPEQIVESRRRSLARHRQFLSWLMLGAVVTLAVGALPGLHILLKAHLAIDLFMVAHMVFLVKTRRKRLEVRASVPAPASVSVPARQSADKPFQAPASRPAQRTVKISTEPGRRRGSRPNRVVDVRTDPKTAMMADAGEALHIFPEDEGDRRSLQEPSPERRRAPRPSWVIDVNTDSRTPVETDPSDALHAFPQGERIAAG